MRVLVHRLIILGAWVAKIGRYIDAMQLHAGGLRRAEQPVDERRGDTVRGGAKQGTDRRLADQPFELIDARELQRRVGALQVRERGADRCARLAVRQDGFQRQARRPRSRYRRARTPVGGLR
jgi:hypothetical protein